MTTQSEKQKALEWLDNEAAFLSDNTQEIHWHCETIRKALLVDERRDWRPDEMEISRVVVNAIRNGTTPTNTIKNVVKAVTSDLNN